MADGKRRMLLTAFNCNSSSFICFLHHSLCSLPSVCACKIVCVLVMFCLDKGGWALCKPINQTEESKHTCMHLMREINQWR